VNASQQFGLRFRQLDVGKGIGMKRRDFFTTAAGIGVGSMMVGMARPSVAADRPDEEPLQIYKCRECGTILQIFQPGSPSLAHCGKPMELLVEKTEDEGREKHVPVIERIERGYKVKVGSVAHPMTEAHSIKGIQLLARDERMICTKVLEPGDKPEATFMTDAKEVMARAYCNLHGLWKGK